MKMARTCDLVAEMTVLSEAVKVQQRAIKAAQSVQDEAEEAFTSFFGFHPSESLELAPGYVAAKAAVEALDHEDGYFWACSRLMDLELALAPPSSQLALRTAPMSPWASWSLWTLAGETPHANVAVWPWLSKIFGEPQLIRHMIAS